MYSLKNIDRKDIIRMSEVFSLKERFDLQSLLYDFIKRKEWYYDYLFTSHDSIKCLIMYESNDVILGMVSLESIDFYNKRAELNVNIIKNNEIEEYLIRNFAIRAILYHAFFVLDLNSITMLVRDINERTLNLYKNIGFKIKEKAQKSTKIYNELSILKEEYGQKENILYERFVKNIKGFCIKRSDSHLEKISAIDLCSNAFNPSLNSRTDINSLYCKWNAAADFFVAYNKQILGFVVQYNNDYKYNTSYITMIAVNPLYHSKGIGSSLLRYSENIAFFKGMTKVVLEVKCNNVQAIKFYDREGYKVMYESSIRNSLYMCKEI